MQRPILTILILSLIACTKAPDYDIVPEITYMGISKNMLDQDQFNTDSLRVFFEFTDGDGDLGDEDGLHVEVTDTRDGFTAARYRIPKVPETGAGNGISGEISLLLFTTCCIYDNSNIPPCTPSTEQPYDTVIYEIFIRDRAGNQSNTIQTEPILVKCN